MKLHRKIAIATGLVGSETRAGQVGRGSSGQKIPGCLRWGRVYWLGAEVAEVAIAGVGGAVILFLIRIAQLKPESRCISTQLKVFLSLLVL